MLEQGNEMGDANLVNGAQMGPCVAARWRQPLAWQSFWQESIYVYCPWLEVATAAAAQVLFRATKCHRAGAEYIGRLSDRPFVSSPAKRFAENYHPIQDIRS